MENDFTLIRPVEGLPTLRQITVDRQTRQGKQHQDQEQTHEEPETSSPQEPLEMTEPDILEGDFHGDDPHAIDYRA